MGSGNLFYLFSVKTIDEGIEILTGVTAGTRKKDGTYPTGTVNYLVDQKLQEYVEKWKQYKMVD